jgi:SAM-dependent methyltransferase
VKNYLRKAVYHILTFVADREKLLFLLAKKNKDERELLGFKRGGYLYDIGWTNSIVSGQVVDAFNNPLPWVTYPFIQFISGRLKKNLEIFEFGSGNSTFYYADKVALVDSVENNEVWYEKIKNTMPQNVKLFFCELENGGDYCKYAAKTNTVYDMIIVDGRDRVNCCINCVKALKPGGVIVLDDSERENYVPALEFLAEQGFRKIDFWGTAPIVNYLKCTTIFYKDNNCLGI